MGKAVRKTTKSTRGSTRSTSARSRNAKTKPRAAETSPSYANEFAAVLLCALGLFVAISLWSQFASAGDPLASNSMGALGAGVATLLIQLLGYCSFSVSLLLFLATRTAWQMEGEAKLDLVITSIQKCIVFVVLLLALATLATISSGAVGGGSIGLWTAEFLIQYVNTAGAVLVSVLVVFLTLIAVTDLSFGAFVRASSAVVGTTARALAALGALVGRMVGAVIESTAALGEAVAEQWESRQLARSEQRSADVEPKERWSSGISRGFVLGKNEEEEEDEIEEEYEEDDVTFDDEDEYDDDEEEEDVDEDFDEDELEEFDVPQAREVKIWRRDTREVVTPAKKASVDQEPRRQLKDYRRPSLDLLVGSDSSAGFGPDDQALLDNSRRLEEALENFRIGGRVVEVHPGPVITLYEFAPAPGVKVQRIISLADDLALALKVASVRVYAPVPGKGTVGVEVPNQQREIVRLRDVLESGEFSQGDTPLPLALGKDTYGAPFVAHLPRMPHLLIAGAPGTGKSVCINSLLLSLLVKNSPDELNLIMIDPKMLELSIYEDIPHLKAPVVTNAKRARGVLWWTVEEMERRYRLLKRYGVRDVAAYNRLCVESEPVEAPKTRRKNVTITLQERDVVATGSPHEGLDRAADSGEDHPLVPASMERLPRIVVVVDELADLMLSVGREIEDLLARLAQKARAAGIHLILATQRPSVNVITGLIKANFPARISFKVTSKIDARTVLDTSGSEKLLGQGDMLFLAPWLGQMKRLHSPYVSDQEVHDVCDWLRSQGAPMYDESIDQMISKLEETESGSSAGAMPNGEEYDEFYDRAVSLVVDKGQASTSMVQRAFRIGYNRAARILETMEREGIVGPADGAKPRQVLIAAVD